MIDTRLQRKQAIMWRNAFIRFHRAAEAAGYPALLVIAMVSLTMVVAAVALLGMVGGAPAFSFAILSLVAALALLTGEIEAALADIGDRPTRRQAGQSASAKPETVVPRGRQESNPEQRTDRPAA